MYGIIGLFLLYQNFHQGAHESQTQMRAKDQLYFPLYDKMGIRKKFKYLLYY